MTAFVAVSEVLDRARDRGARVDLWWRDDDATEPNPGLDRLLRLTRQAGASLALAVIPAFATGSLATRLVAEPDVSILVHGWRHANHAAPTAKASEFGGDRALATREEETRAGLTGLNRVFGAQAKRVFVPPWNRIGADLVARLPELGYTGLSTFGRRKSGGARTLKNVNTHLDPVDWRGSRGALPVTRIAEALEKAIGPGSVGSEPIGLLTHHLAFDEALWSFTAELVDCLSRHPATRWLPARDLWNGGCH